MSVCSATPSSLDEATTPSPFPSLSAPIGQRGGREGVGGIGDDDEVLIGEMLLPCSNLGLAACFITDGA